MVFKVLKYSLLILIVIMIIILINSINFSTKSSSESTVFAEEVYDYSISYSDEQINQFERLNATQVYVYGETLNIEIADNPSLVVDVVDTASAQVVDQYQIESQIDVGVPLESLPIGSYFLRTTDFKYISYDDLDISMQTITRDGVSNHVDIDIVNGLLHITKYEGTSANTDIDILIDPGHGGVDTGAEAYDGSVYESDLNLIVAEKLADELSNLGYSVALTREEDIRPGSCDDQVSAYCEDGRVTQVYELKPKLVVSLHHNTGGASGFEVYSSYYSSHNFANLIADNLSIISDYSTKVTGYVQDGVYVETYEDDEGLNTPQDGMYMVRETGGIATKSVNDKNKPNNQLPFGAEAVLVEFGYLDNYLDLAHVTTEQIIEQEVDALASAVDDYIKLDESKLSDLENTSEEDALVESEA